MKLQTLVNIEDFRANLADYIGRVMYAKEKIIIKKYNRDAAVVISPDEYELLINPTKRFDKKTWASKFEVFDKIKKRNKQKSTSEVEKDIAKVLK